MSRRRTDALCRVEVAAVRAEPADAAEQVTQLLHGEPVAVDHDGGGWSRVVTAYGYPGWVRTDALRPVAQWPRGWPGPPRDGDPVAQARAYLGAPYEWGGMTPHGIDCSGLVHMAHRRLGRLVPRDADQQEEAGEPVGRDDLRPGDLVTYGETRATHVAFWLGGGRILHSTGRDGAGVVDEAEPADLAAVVRRHVRFVFAGDARLAGRS